LGERADDDKENVIVRETKKLGDAGRIGKHIGIGRGGGYPEVSKAKSSIGEKGEKRRSRKEGRFVREEGP